MTADGSAKRSPEEPGIIPVRNDRSSVSSARDLSIAFAAFGLGLGGLVLLGWALDVELLKSPLSDRVSMKANTAASIALVSAALVLFLSGKRAQRLLGGVLALGPLTVGLLTLVEWATDRDLGIDQLLFTETAGTVGTTVPGRMAPITAIALFLLGAALLFLVLDRGPATVVAQVLAAAAGFVGILGLLPNLYGLPATGGVIGRHTQMAIHTSVAVLVLSAGVQIARPDRGFVRVATREGAGGALARRGLLVVIVVPVLLGWLAVAGQRLDLYDSRYRASVMTAASVASLVILVWLTAHMLDRAEERRERAERLRADVFRSNPGPAWITRMSDGLFVDVNQAFADTFGRAREELIGRSSLELDIWTDPAEREAVMEALRAHGTVEGAEARLRAADGRDFPALFSVRMVAFDGDPHLVGSLLDITDRRRAEELLRQREAELREGQRIAHMGSWTLDSATDHVSWTDELYLMLGLEPGRPPPDYSEHQRLFTPESWARLTTALSRTREAGAPYELELEMVRGDGSTGWMLAHGEAVRDASGAIVGLRGTAQDITERKRVEEERERSARRIEALHGIAFNILAARSTEELARVALSRLRELVPAMRASVTRFDETTQELVLIAISAEAATQVGIGARFPLSAAGPADRLLRGEINLVVGTLEVADPAPSIRRLIEEGVRTYVNVPMVFEGELIGTLNMSADSRGGFGEEHLEVGREVAAMLAVAIVQSDLRDEQRRQNEVLEERVAERTSALAESEARFRSVLANAPDGILVVDPVGVIALANDTAATLYRYEVAELIGMSVEALVPEQLRGTHSTHRERYLADPAARPMGTGLALRGRRKDGTEFPADISLSTIPVRGAHENPHVIAFVRDVTERMRAEQEIVEARAEAERANRAKDEFLSRMSHELRTPLNAVLGFAQMLELGELGAEQRESVGQILRAGRHLLQLVDEVLDVSRIASGTMSLSLEPVPVGDVVRECVGLIDPMAWDQGLNISVTPEDGVHVHADRQRLRQVLMNLLSNAVKYNRQGGSIDVAWEREGDRIRIEVRDSGVGIAEQDLERLFEPFERIGAEAAGIQGTGLGLPLSKALAEEMDGDLRVESSVGAGTVFILELWVAEAPPEGVEPPPLAATIVHGRSGTVLCVEDNPSNLLLVERVLARLPGVRLLTAMQGRLGLELARQHRPDVILLDLHLPDMSGQEALGALAADAATSSIPVVVVSADATPNQIERLRSAGAADYLTKPYDVTRLLEVVGGFLRGA